MTPPRTPRTRWSISALTGALLLTSLGGCPSKKGGVAPAVAAGGPPPAAATNVLLLTLDQLPYTWFEATSPERVTSRTRNLDRLVAEGAVFLRHYTDAETCHPARSSILTGRPPVCHGAIENGVELSEKETTLAEVLSNEGYATCAIGKIHSPEEGALQGFDLAYEKDYFRAIQASNGWTPENSIKWTSERFMTGIGLVPEELREEVLETDVAIDFIEAQAGAPWFLYLSYSSPHPPWAPSQEALDKFAGQSFNVGLPDLGVWALKPLFQQQHFAALGFDMISMKEAEAQHVAFAAEIEEVDKQIGRLLDYLETQGALDDTIIVFTSDHGDMGNQLGVFNKLFGPYESVAHVPMVLRYPPAIPAGASVDEFTQGIDVAPTVYELLDIPSLLGITGHSVVDLVHGGPPVREMVFSVHEGWPISWMVNDGRFVYIHHPGDDNELYDLQVDPKQRDNVFEEPVYFETRKRLQREIETWRATTCP